MKQIFQRLGNGETMFAELPHPSTRRDHFLVQTRQTLVSIGTERMLIDFGKASWIEKARKQPDKVKQVLEKAKTDGVFSTMDAVKAKLGQPIALGYCNVGCVVENARRQISEVGDQRSGDAAVGLELRPWDRVVSNGPHAEVVCVPKNLCAKIPDSVPDDDAAFTVVGAVGLQGVRLIQPTLGECIAVTGLGLIGLIAVQFLRAHGCRVLGMDLDSSKCALARQFGAETVDFSKGEDPVTAAMAFSRDRGLDGVLITASTQSNEPVHQAAQMCRKRGRIVLVGVTGLQLSRADFYEKELSFQVSCSYGPGRYDENYEQKGHDYPVGFVRWTSQRNFEAVLDMMADRRIDVRPLISHRFPFEDALKAYDLVAQGKGLGILLEYGTKGGDVGGRRSEVGVGGREAEVGDQRSDVGGRRSENAEADGRLFARTIALKPPSSVLRPPSSHNLTSDLRSPISCTPVIGLIGAGNFTGMVLLPALAKTEARLKTIASSGGVTGTHFGRKFGFEFSTTDTDSILNDPDINTVLITTRHNSHAKYVIAALNAGKNVYVEKPLCLNRYELEEIVATYSQFAETGVSRESNAPAESNVSSPTSDPRPPTSPSDRRTVSPLLMVGFNRRFAPQIVKIKSLLESVREPKTLIMTVNAGQIPANHWTQDPEVGGGRVIGEGCHFIDLLRHLVGKPITGVQAVQVDVGESGAVADDKITFTLTFSDGSIGTVHYFANGNKSFPKERFEVFCAGRVLQLDNFRKLRGYGWPGFKKINLWRQDKGHRAEMETFISAVRDGKGSPIPFDEIVEVTRVSFEVVEAARERLAKFEIRNPKP